MRIRWVLIVLALCWDRGRAPEICTERAYGQCTRADWLRQARRQKCQTRMGLPHLLR